MKFNEEDWRRVLYLALASLEASLIEGEDEDLQ